MRGDCGGDSCITAINVMALWESLISVHKLPHRAITHFNLSLRVCQVDDTTSMNFNMQWQKSYPEGKVNAVLGGERLWIAETDIVIVDSEIGIFPITSMLWKSG